MCIVRAKSWCANHGCTGGLALGLWALLALPVLAACGAPSSHSLAALKGDGMRPVPPGRTVTIEATVSAAFTGDKALSGFYLQTQQNGVFVYAPKLAPDTALKAGQRWRMQARTGRYRGRIQLEHPQALEYCGDGSLTTQALAQLSNDQYASLADQRVRITQPLVVADTYHLGRYGSMRVAVGGRAFHPGNGVSAGRVLELVVDDGSYRRNPQPVPHGGREQVYRAGDEIAPFTGIITRAFGQWRIHPLEPLQSRVRNPRPSTLAKPLGNSLRAVNFNLYNYFIDHGSRGAKTPEAFARQRQRLGKAIHAMDADILALHEVQNAPAAVADLLALLNTNQPVDQHYQAARMQRGPAAIRSVLLYRSARLSLEQVRSDRASVHPREPVAAVFAMPSGQRFQVAVAHFKSRGGCPDSGDIDRGQGCWANRRQTQAQTLSTWLQAGDTDMPVLLLGDLNSYATEDAMAPWYEAGYVDLVAQAVAPADRYTYIYRGRSGYLDHALATPAFAHWINSVQLWPINADESAYRADSEQGIWRASDHDPIIVDWHFSERNSAQ